MRLIVTDITHMSQGACVAGYTDDAKQCIRPVMAKKGRKRENVPWEILAHREGHLIQPLDVLNIDVSPCDFALPHTEDMELNSNTAISYEGRVPDNQHAHFLSLIESPSIRDLYRCEIDEKKRVVPGAALCSLGLVRATMLHYLYRRPHDPSGKTRARFTDQSGIMYDLPVTDVGLNGFIRFLTETRNITQGMATRIASERLSEQDGVYLRIGLTRPFIPYNGNQQWCYLMVTGVISLPGYRTVPWHRIFPTPDAANPDAGLNAIREQLAPYIVDGIAF